MPCFLLVGGVFYVFILMAIAAARLNKQFNIHKDILLEIITSFRERQIYKESEQISKVIEDLSFIIEKLENDKELRPVKLYGITVDN
mmetsp:Transcript_24935/g.4127  ORF Transcript_24935/g.4127 Transcript_24935/m.4127 type:complete len:87 (-) Transcript_24935:52-312(-)